MKKILLFLLLFTWIVKAQIVNIPDANFKAKLLSSSSLNGVCDNNPDIFLYQPCSENDTVPFLMPINIDSNNDGEIQESEAALVKKLNIGNSNIIDLTGIEAFVNLISLNCGNNQITSLNLSSCTSLRQLTCSNNPLINFNFANCPSLIEINCTETSFSIINIANNLNLTSINCGGSNLNNVVFGQNSSLIAFSCTNSPLISSFDFVQSINLKEINIINLPINSLDLIQNAMLCTLNIANCPLSTLNVSQNVNLYSIGLVNTLVSNLDFSTNINLFSFVINQNQNLVSINLKNGFENFSNTSVSNGMWSTDFTLNPNLTFVCLDDSEIPFVQNTFPLNVSINSYCSFAPGGQYNTITGTTKFDINNNGCELTDPVMPNVKVSINDGTNSGATFTNNFGNYTFYSAEPNLYLEPILENPTYFNSYGSALNFLNGSLGQTANQDFCITANGIYNDLEVVVSPIAFARPGFDAKYNIVFKNKGNQTLSGNVNFNFDDAVMDFVSSTLTPSSQSTGILNWNYANLLPFESRYIEITLNVNAPTATPAVNIGDILNFTASITPTIADDLPNDNTFSYNQTVVGSFDPNDITCLEGTSVAPSAIGDYLHYMINFENTGNFPAENVVVKTIIDPAKFDINSLQLLNTSSPVDARITGNVVEFIFKNIQLAGPGGHGHVLLKVKSKSILVAGDNVSKRADIFFDYNFPIDTGLATTIFQNLSNSVFKTDNSVSVSPNPATSKININCNSTIKSIELYDVQGRVLETVLNANSLDITNKTNGIYFLKITTDNGAKVEKIVKE